MLRLLLAVCLLAISMPFAAHAQQSIAVVSLQELVATSKASKDIGKQLEKKRATVLKELSAAEKKLVEIEKNLIETRKDLSKEDFAKKVQVFEKDKITLQKKSLAYQNTLAKASLKAEKALLNEVVSIVGDVAKENSYDLVLTKQNVVVGSDSIDITAEVLKRLNKAVPKMSVEFGE